jgi:hypothetical protein
MFLVICKFSGLNFVVLLCELYLVHVLAFHLVFCCDGDD